MRSRMNTPGCRKPRPARGACQCRALLAPGAAGVKDGGSSAYLRQLWEAVRRDFARVVTDRSGLSASTLDVNDDPAVRRGNAARYYPLKMPVHDAQHAMIRHVDVILRLDSLLSRVSLDARFGRSEFGAGGYRGR